LADLTRPGRTPDRGSLEKARRQVPRQRLPVCKLRSKHLAEKPGRTRRYFISPGAEGTRRSTSAPQRVVGGGYENWQPGERDAQHRAGAAQAELAHGAHPTSRMSCSTALTFSASLAISPRSPVMLATASSASLR